MSKIITLFILFSPPELDGVILQLENIQLKNSLQTTCQLHHTVLSATQNLHLGQVDSILYMKLKLIGKTFDEFPQKIQIYDNSNFKKIVE